MVPSREVPYEAITNRALKIVGDIRAASTLGENANSWCQLRRESNTSDGKVRLPSLRHQLHHRCTVKETETVRQRCTYAPEGKFCHSLEVWLEKRASTRDVSSL